MLTANVRAAAIVERTATDLCADTSLLVQLATLWAHAPVRPRRINAFPVRFAQLRVPVLCLLALVHIDARPFVVVQPPTGRATTLERSAGIRTDLRAVVRIQSALVDVVAASRLLQKPSRTIAPIARVHRNATARLTVARILRRAYVRRPTRPSIVVQLVVRRTGALEAAEHIATMITVMLELRALIDVDALAAAGRTVTHSVRALFGRFNGIIHLVVLGGGRLLTAVRAGHIDAAVHALIANVWIVAFVDIWRNTKIFVQVICSNQLQSQLQSERTNWY